MKHITNRAAFLKCDPAEPFFRLYTLLVAIELALKDHTTHWSKGHDLDNLVGGVSAPNAAGLTAAMTTLSASLGKIRCTTKQGTSAFVSASFYPALRYLRFTSDGFTDGSSSADVSQALSAALTLRQELQQAGVTL